MDEGNVADVEDVFKLAKRDPSRKRLGKFWSNTGARSPETGEAQTPPRISDQPSTASSERDTLT